MGKKKGSGSGEDTGPGAKAKAQKSAARKEKEEQARQAKAERVDADWMQGANARQLAKQKAQEEKEAAKLAAKEAKKAAELADDVEINSMRATRKKDVKKGKSKKKNDLSMLDAFMEEENKAKAKKAAAKSRITSSDDQRDLLKPNMNRVMAEEAAKGNIHASGLDNALAALNVDGEQGGKGPSRKQAYAAFEERELPRLREEYPSLKLSQLKDKLWKEWQKHPDNPANQEQ